VPPWRQVWRATTQRIVDSASNVNNRFEVANAINAATGIALFWGKPRGERFAGLDHLASTMELPGGLEANPLARYRRTETVSGERLSTNWQLLGAGSVGSQVLTGLPVLEHLVGSFDSTVEVSVWPFDGHRGQLTIAEVWPGRFARGHPPLGVVRDRWQVETTARTLIGLDDATWTAFLRPASISTLDPLGRRSVLEEEGWMLGVR
jgi:hypothetical protein